MYHTIEMSLKVIVFIAFFAVLSCEGKSYPGFPLPFYPHHTNDALETAISAYPWHVSLQWGYSSYTHFCNGAIVDARWVLTSAHCASVVPSYGDFVVKAGKQNLKIAENSEQTVAVEKSIIYKYYTGIPNTSDLALLKLSSPLNMTTSVSKINLPATSTPANGTVRVTTWGAAWRTYSPIMPNKLRVLELKTMSIAACNDSVINLTGVSPLHKHYNVCTAPLTGGFTACNIDPGSPLVVKSNNQFVLYGIGSWIIVPCGTTGAPSIYVNVPIYTTWIKNIIKSSI